MLKSREIEVKAGSPFANDALNRKASAEILTEFIKSSNEPIVICIDAPWGQGKTTFLRMWEQYLKDNSIPTLYFNAWENDFSNDALICLIGEISSSITELSKNGDETKARQYLTLVKNLGINLVKKSIPVAAKIATAGIINFDELTEEALAELAESAVKEQLESYEKSKKTISTFKSTLSDFALSISSKESPKPLVFIIDELDRCRPNFAIEILEKAKHFFSVENIIFVLGADKEQLGSSIKSIYGNDVNVNGYLRRFIDIDYVFPSPNKGLFVNHLFEKFLFHDYFSKKTHPELVYEGKQSLIIFTDMFEILQLTLREQEHCCSLLSLSMRTTPHDKHLFPLFLCFLIVLKVKSPNIYKKFINNDLSPLQLIDDLNSSMNAGELFKNNYGILLEAYIVTSIFYTNSEEIYAHYRKIIETQSNNTAKNERASNVLKTISEFEYRGNSNSLKYLVNKIEMVSLFNV